jgi:hypothetical protein
MPVFSNSVLKPVQALKAASISLSTGVADGFEAFCLARLVEEIGERGPVMYIVRDGQRIADLEQVLNFVSPDCRFCIYRRGTVFPMIAYRRGLMPARAGLRHLPLWRP